MILIIVGIILYIPNCTIVLPPISVTGTKTAAEKQIIGEQTELEKDVWMISSAKTSSHVDLTVSQQGTQDQKNVEEENSYTYKGFAILEIFNSELLQLRKDGVVGENNKGLVTNLLLQAGIEILPEIREKYSPELRTKSSMILQETVKQINLSRGYIVEGYILNQKRINPDFSPDKNELVKSQAAKYQSLLQKGEYLQTEDGVWTKKK